MRMHRPLLSLALLVATTAHIGFAQTPAQQRGRQMAPADLKAWKSIRQTVLSADGKWFAYVVAPNEGDGSVVIRHVADTLGMMTYSVGDAGGGRGARAGAPPADEGGAPGSVVITADSKWAAFIIAPAAAPAGGRGGRGGRGGGRGAGGGGAAAEPGANQNRMALVNLATGEKKEFPRVRRFAFNGDTPTWVAMQGYPEAAAPTAGAAGGAAPASRPTGTDVTLYNLATGAAANVGNVAEFAFNDDGDWLAYTIDAHDQIGNGLQLRNMKTDQVRAIESDRAVYRHLAWSDSGSAVGVLRGKPDSATSDTLFQVVTVTGFVASRGKEAELKKTIFDPAGRADFPAGYKVSADRAPRFSDDLSTVFFGIHELKSPLLAGRGRGETLVQAGAPGMGGTNNMPRVNETENEDPSLIIWHGRDPRLQSQQIVQEQQDRAFNYLVSYHFVDNKFTRLADTSLRQVNTVGHDRFAYGIDTREYDLNASYSGRRYEDVYSVDVKTGARKQLFKKRLNQGPMIPSPDGGRLLYWGDNAQWWVLDLTTGEKHDITTGIPTQFADTSDDHNNLVVPPGNALGWSKDGLSVLLSDAFDVWKVPTRGPASGAVNLTGNGVKDQIRYQRLYDFGLNGTGAAAGRGGRGGRGGGGFADGIDLTKPLYFATYGEWTKNAGLSRVEPNKPGAQRLVWDSAAFNFQRAKDADVFLYTRQTEREFPNYFVANPNFQGGRQLTDADPQQRDFAWTSGVRLINYTSDKGDKLQGALYLPANYEPGKKYPLLVTIYEKRSNLAHTYVTPSETSTPNRSIYTSRGYAVLDPDIVYKVNDPGMSAVWCVIPAVKAALATGVVDSAHMGLWGHSWGGYQTAFLVTQTNLFHSAIAGAPLTNMVSMYGSIYWNSGGGDNAIFESSQGRFKGDFISNYDAYIRNSPVFHADKVTTPLIILSDDKDGAVDFNQGITYYSTLRELKKDVILLEYVGENHGLARPVNMKDYATRQADWFNHYLMGAPAPEWMTQGIPRNKMEEYWASLKKPAGPILP